MNFSKHKPEHSLEVLQKTLRYAETIRRSLTKIRAEDVDGAKYTIGEHDRSVRPSKVPHLVAAKDDGSFAGPDGTELAFEGEAWIENTRKKVAVFR